MKNPNNENDSKRNKVIALITTLTVHSLLLVCFVFMGLTYQVPPPPEYGIEVDMGGGGGGGGNPKTGNKPTHSSASAASDNISTQNLEESVALNTTRKPSTKPQTAPVENQPKVEETPTVNPNALFTRRTTQSSDGGSGGGSGGGTGTGYGTGTGSGTGSGSGSGSGGGIGSGMGDGIGDFFLNGRPVVNKAYPNAKNNLEGVVKVDFRADRDGNVVYAKAGIKGTTIIDQQIWEECEKAAKRSKFKAKSDAQMEEKGVITYRFILQ